MNFGDGPVQRHKFVVFFLFKKRQKKRIAHINMLGQKCVLFDDLFI